MPKKITAAEPFELSRGTVEYYQNPTMYDFDFKKYAPDKKFYLNMALSIGGPVLEIGCGSGRLMLDWIKKGIEVKGIDISEDMLKTAERKLTRAGKKYTHLWSLDQGDMISWNDGNKYNLIVSAFNTMMHLYTSEDMDLFLDNIKRNLGSGGTFIFDILNPDFRWFLRDPEKRWSRTRFKHPVHGCWYYYTTNHYYDAEEQISYVYIYHEPVNEGDGPDYTMRLAHRFYYPQEMLYILKRHGFILDSVLGGFDGSALDMFSTSQVYICSL